MGARSKESLKVVWGVGRDTPLPVGGEKRRSAGSRTRPGDQAKEWNTGSFRLMSRAPSETASRVYTRHAVSGMGPIPPARLACRRGAGAASGSEGASRVYTRDGVPGRAAPEGRADVGKPLPRVHAGRGSRRGHGRRGPQAEGCGPAGPESRSETRAAPSGTPLPEPFEGDGPRRDSARGGGGPMRAVSPGDPRPAVSPTLAFTQVGGPDVAPGHRRAAAGSRRERSRRAVAAIREGMGALMAGGSRCERSLRGLAATAQGLAGAQLGLCPARPAVPAEGARRGHSLRESAAVARMLIAGPATGPGSRSPATANRRRDA
jgi:hypothetical protein